MRVIQERNSGNTPTVSYVRGNDLSGSLEGAGGIGGMLARLSGYSSGSWGTANYYHADGGGNITKIIDSSQSAVATYVYDPYGNSISSSGTLASANTYRFSSKEWHANSGIYYYGYRFYDPTLQRWLNRDPIEEDGGLNLFRFVGNNPAAWIDPSGLKNVKTGVKICKGKAVTCGLVDHEWIELDDGTSIDIVASGSIFGSPALVSSPSDYSDRKKKCKDVILDDRKYDPEKFRRAVKREIDFTLEFTDPDTHQHAYLTYCAGIFDCRTFSKSLIDIGKKKSRLP